MPSPPDSMRAKNRWRLVLAALLALAVGATMLLGLGVRKKLTTNGWTFAGVDSYHYIGAAGELYAHHRYAFRLPPWSRPPSAPTPPLGYCRPPGYSLFLAAAVHKELGNTYESYLPYFQRAVSAQRLLDLFICALVFMCARRLGGAWAGWLALLGAALSPSLALFSTSILSETLATFLTTLTLLLLLYVLDAPRDELPRKKWAMRAAGAVTALGMLVRPDGVLLLPCLFLPAFLRAVPLRLALQSLLICALFYSPWPLRNLLQFGRPHLLATLCDTRGQALEAKGFSAWFATWLEQENELPQTLWCLLRPECPARITDYPLSAFDSLTERQVVATLLHLRNKEGVSPRVDQSFAALARHRLRSHPIRTLLVLPARRLYYLWTTPNVQPLNGTLRMAWPQVIDPLLEKLPKLTLATVLLGLLGLCVLFARKPQAALLLAMALALRCTFLAITALVETRYLVELLPAVLILGGVGVSGVVSGVVSGIAAGVRGFKQPRPHAPPTS